ncbi:uncharacterized protein C1orf194 homolog [Thrips palmi]|uniref:Uncharacterized protein C1orf194 homolog n=1 Tax=Thrips palmi TaxID=161013 RepID=A0A6P8YAM0_THRPL|nr:uncharacterized protein C1orf194 homolog [Thrips palmi]
MPVVCGERLVRNHGPFPLIQSEGYWKQLPDTRTVHVPPPAPDGPCPPPLDADQVQALLRHQEYLRLQQARGRARKEDGADKDESGVLPVGQTIVDPTASPRWADCLSPWERLNTHHTLASVRRHAQMHRAYEPRDQLDYALSSAYHHDSSLWADGRDVCLQPETLGRPTWRVLRNLRVLPEDPVEDRGHPLRQSGLSSKVSVHSVKLAISGNHMSQTNAGFSRKVDGTFYS